MEFLEDQWENVLEEAQDEVNQDIPHAQDPVAPPVFAGYRVIVTAFGYNYYWSYSDTAANNT